MRVVRPAAMAEIDRRAQEEFHIPAMVLMENAGVKALQRLIDIAPQVREKSLLFIAGGGNNGGDALVMARQARVQMPRAVVRVVLVKAKLGELAGVHAASVKALGIPVAVWEEEGERSRRYIAEAQWIFDGIAGTGLAGALRAPLDTLSEAVNAARESGTEAASKSGDGDTDMPGTCLESVVAIDVPSGIGVEFTEGMPAVRADLTLTMGLPKTVLYTLHARALCGRIERIRLGFPPQLLEEPEDSGVLIEEVRPRRESERGYKGSRGHTALFAGAVGTTGAAALAARAAAAAGSGLVTLYCDGDIYPQLSGGAEGVMVKPSDAASGVSLERHSALVAGPGWGKGREDSMKVLMESGLPAVADADALRAAYELSGAALPRRDGRAARGFFGGRWVLTPHPGEFALISDIDRNGLFRDPVSAVRESAERLQAVVVLKAHVSYVAAPDGRYAIVDGMNPAMGTGGSGDVLSGLIGGLLAGGIEPFDAACRGVFVHQEAGKVTARRGGWFTAEELPPVIARLMYHGGEYYGSGDV